MAESFAAPLPRTAPSFAAVAEAHLDDGLLATRSYVTRDPHARGGSRRDVRARAASLAALRSCAARPHARGSAQLARNLRSTSSAPNGGGRRREETVAAARGREAEAVFGQGLSAGARARRCRRLSAAEREVIALRIVLDLRHAAGRAAARNLEDGA